MPAIVVAVAAVVSAVAAVAAGQSQKNAADYNAKVLQNKARDDINRGNIQAQEIRDRARRLQGTQAAQYGAAGLDLNSGTPSDVLSQTKQFGELDALKAINNAQRGAWDANANAELELFNGKQAMQRGYMNAGASLLSGASSIYGQSASMR